MIVLAAASFALGAVGRRIAGGALPEWTPWNAGDQVVRLFFGATVAVAALMAGLGWWSAAMVPAVWVGTTTSNFDSMAMGRGGNSYLRDFAGMTLHGLLSAALPGLLLWWLGHAWWPVLLYGLLIAPCYEVGWRLVGPYKKGWPPGLNVGTGVAELLWGGCVGLLTYLAVVM